MLPLSVFSGNDNLEVPDKHTGVYITHKTHLVGQKSIVHSCPVSHSGHMSHNSAFIWKWKIILNVWRAFREQDYCKKYM